jgi:hypothetical protein
MTSDEKTFLPSLLQLIKSDLFTFKNISSSVTLEVPNSGIKIDTTASDSAYAKADAEKFMQNTSKWEAVVKYLPLEFFDIINSIDGMVQVEKFDKKYIRNPKMCAYDKYSTTNMWRPLMILNRCPRIQDFNFDYIRYYNIEKFSNVISLLMSRVGTL